MSVIKGQSPRLRCDAIIGSITLYKGALGPGLVRFQCPLPTHDALCPLCPADPPLLMGGGGSDLEL